MDQCSIGTTWPAEQARDSRIATFIHDHFPEAPDTTQALRRVLGPRVFEGLGPAQHVRRDVHAGHVPAALGQGCRVAPGAAADVEQGAARIAEEAGEHVPRLALEWRRLELGVVPVGAADQSRPAHHRTDHDDGPRRELLPRSEDRGSLRQVGDPTEIVGAVIYLVARDQFSGLNPQYWYFWIGLLLIAVVIFVPNGIVGGVAHLVRRRTKP